MFVKWVAPSRDVRLYACAPAGVAAPTAAATSRRIRDRGPMPSMPPLYSKSDTVTEFPEVSRGSGALLRSGPGSSLTGGDHSLSSPPATVFGRRLTPAHRLTTVGPLRNPVREEPTDGRLDAAHPGSGRGVFQGAQQLGPLGSRRPARHREPHHGRQAGPGALA